MKHFFLVSFFWIILSLAGFGFWRMHITESLSADPSEIEASTDSVTPKKTHRVTNEMMAAVDKAAGNQAPDFIAPASDGKMYRLSEMTKDGPAVLIFIKEGCPCSRSADEFHQRVHAAGRGWVPFYGVINGDVKAAERWVELTHSIFPILADPELKITKSYGAASSAYVAFIGQGGRIEKLWAGYSESMLRELADRMARWVKPGMEPFDVSDAPADLYAGCPY